MIDGYATIFQEIDAQLAALGASQPDLVAAQIGVGALAASVVRHYRATGLGDADRRRRADCAPLVCCLGGGRWTDRGAGPARLDHGRAELRTAVAGRLALVSGGISLFVAVPDSARRGGDAPARSR